MPIPKKTKTITPFTEEDADQIRAAVNAVGHLEGYPSITEFIEAATMPGSQAREVQVQPGKNWPGVPAGQLRPAQDPRRNPPAEGGAHVGSVS